MEPNVYLTDQASEEDPVFMSSVQAHADRQGRSVVKMPVHAAQGLKWITRLDHSALSGMLILSALFRVMLTLFQRGTMSILRS